VGEIFRSILVVRRLTAPTLFSERHFADAVVRSGFQSYRTIDIGTMVGVATGALGRRVYLSPLGLYAAPDNFGSVAAAIDQLMSPRNRSFRWVVRFDHESIARQLRTSGARETVSSTHVLTIGGSHSDQFAKFSETRRRQVRKSAAEGVTVRRGRTAADVNAYFAIHRSLSGAKGRADDYPAELFHQLVTLDEALLFLAEKAGAVIGGALFFRDGDSLFYWHGASDRAHSKAYPTCAIFDQAIRLACDEQRRTVNFGASLGVSSLEDFKSSWGATPQPYWKFEWTHPIWKTAKRVGARARSLVGTLRAISTGNRNAR
jgi:predicted N-acyltransferase